MKASVKSKLYPEKIRVYIHKNHKGRGPMTMVKELNEKFNTSYSKDQIKAYYSNNGYNSGLDGRFQKGHQGGVQIKRGMRISKETEFKKGQRPWNWKPIGSERINGDGYVDIKVQDGKKQKNWKAKHIILWEEVNGPVPQGHVVIFADGDHRNFDLDNLILISKKKLLIMNRQGLIKNDAELTKIGTVIAELQSTINSLDNKYKS